MKEISLQAESIDLKQIESNLRIWLDSFPAKLRRVLLLPPDFTRYHSKAGPIVQILYQILAAETQVDILPALGTHVPMNNEEIRKMFGPEIPLERFFAHDWRNDLEKIGDIPGDFVAEVSGGLVKYPISVELNRKLFDPNYDLVVSIGQVVPHEVVGMANYNKNIFVGCGGKDIINKSHFLGAAFGMERMMGRDHSPVRQVFDYAEEHFLKNVPLQYILTVTTTKKQKTRIKGFYVGRSRKLFEAAVTLSQKENLDLLSRPLKKVVVFLDPEEFKSTWLGNKAIYRTRMAIANAGELIILAPGVKQFGEDPTIDGLIRKYGYVGSKRVLQLVEREADLQTNLSAAAHLIHGSSEDRFVITYAPGGLTLTEVQQANFKYLPYKEAVGMYNPETLENGFNTLANGDEIFYISNPALGLWALGEKFNN